MRDEWLDGIPPVRQNKKLNKSARLLMFPVISLITVFTNWAKNQLETQARKMGLENSKCNCPFTEDTIPYYTPPRENKQEEGRSLTTRAWRKPGIGNAVMLDQVKRLRKEAAAPVPKRADYVDEFSNLGYRMILYSDI
jgi:hypothetical protein